MSDSHRSGLLPILAVAILLAAGGAVFLFQRPDGGGEDRPAPVQTGSPAEAPGSGRAARPPVERIEPVPFREGEEALDGVFPPLASDLNVSGIVVDGDGTPVRGAVMRLLEDRSSIKARPEEGAVLAEGKTGGDGRYRFSLPSERGLYLVRADHESYATGRHHPVDPQEPSTLAGRILLQQGHSVAGWVRDRAGASIEGARVSIHDMAIASRTHDGALERETLTDARGQFELHHLRPGMKRLLVVKTGYAKDGREPLEVPSRMPEQEKIQIVLAAGATIEGYVADATTGMPVPGAVVGCRPIGGIRAPERAPPGLHPDDEAGEFGQRHREGAVWARPSAGVPRGDLANIPQFEISTVSGEDGRFVLADVPEALFTLQVQAEGYLFLAGRTAKAGDSGVALELNPSPRVRGQVIDARTRQPVARFSLVPSPSEVANWLPNADRAFNNPRGEFDLPLPRPGTWYIHAKAEGYAEGLSSPVLVKLGGQPAEGVLVELGRGTTLVGRVAGVDGTGIPRARVEISPHSAMAAENPFAALFRQAIRRSNDLVVRTDARGIFSIPGVPSGQYRCDVTAPGFAPGHSEAFSCAGEDEVAIPDVILLRGGRISGTVITDGKPDSAATVMLSSDDKSRTFSANATTDSEGRYFFEGLFPGNYRLVVTQRNGQIDLARLLQSPGEPDRRVAVEDGANLEVHL